MRSNFDGSAVDGVIRNLGYISIADKIYKRSLYDSEVEHFLYFEYFGESQQYLTCKFGVRYKRADLFAIVCIRKYGSTLSSLLRYNDRVDCLMRFSFGRVAGWGTRWAIDTLQAGARERAQSDLQKLLLPFVSSTKRLGDLFDVLLADEEPCPWYLVSGALRAAIVVDLARRTAVGEAQVREALGQHHASIRTQLVKGPVSHPADFVDRLIRERSQWEDR
jgi:hypothetical protein